MESYNNNPTRYLISISNGYTVEEMESIKIYQYYDKNNNRLLSFTYNKKNELFILMNQKTFGSAFYGNMVLYKPNISLIIKIDPLLLLVNIMLNYYNEVKFGNKPVEINTIIEEYGEAIKEQQKYTKNFNAFDSLNFISKLLNDKINNLNGICYVSGIFVKPEESRILTYLNQKINITEDENKEINY